MPARFVYWMNVSIDGFVERDEGELGDAEGPEWMRIDEPLHREFNARAAAMTLSVEGRVVRDMMDPFWPDARTDESMPAFMREYGEVWTDQPKVLVSRTRTSADHNTRVIGGDDAIEQLAVLREESEGDIGVGGPNLATQLLDAGLLDELLLYTHPAVLGAGRPLFDPPVTGVRPPVLLDLLEQREYHNGVTLHRYQVLR
ncbi:MULTISPECIES: dihydrofolate reductase family protein [Curtobacterium]|uniref:dihydrofolate reductase family protein n=1 Tax=Curtobacterium TaxID=2034 RepID=UPI00188A7F18|nr:MULTISPECIES: dihydrofolate reductase family protein [Curtobacterium]MBF4605903.1 dihydrofolate reductase family protein [Curtobacterium sp. VKM Ac-2884]MBT1623990.1 dihydrofolate reductase family protein [Curtobacterium flaccumfaciens pv. oortii]